MLYNIYKIYNIYMYIYIYNESKMKNYENKTKEIGKVNK